MASLYPPEYPVNTLRSLRAERDRLREALDAYRDFDDVIDTLRDARREAWGRVAAFREALSPPENERGCARRGLQGTGRE